MKRRCTSSSPSALSVVVAFLLLGLATSTTTTPIRARRGRGAVESSSSSTIPIRRHLSLADKTDTTATAKTTTTKNADDDDDDDSSTGGGHATPTTTGKTTPHGLTDAAKTTTTTAVNGTNSNTNTFKAMPKGMNKPRSNVTIFDDPTTSGHGTPHSGTGYDRSTDSDKDNATVVNSTRPVHPAYGSSARTIRLPEEPRQPESWTWTVLVLFGVTAVALLVATVWRRNSAKRAQYEAVGNGHNNHDNGTPLTV